MPRSFIAQSSVRDALSAGYAGMLATSCPSHVGHGVNTSRQTVTIAVTADNEKDFAVYITQFGATTEYTVTSDSDATAGEIVDLLVAAINGGSQAVTAVDGGNSLSIVADHAAPEYAFTVSTAAGGTGALAATTTIVQAAEIPDGHLVVFDATISSEPMAVRLPTASGDITGNVAVAGIKLADNVTSVRSGEFSKAPGMVGFVRKGQVYVRVEEQVSANSVVYVRYAAGGNGLGAFGASAGTSERALLNGAVYRTAAAPGELAIVEMNIIGG